MELDSVFDGLLESYMNDYYIFETILKQDYYEISGVLTEASIKNILVNIWEKIVQAFNWIKNKIEEIINKFLQAKDRRDDKFNNALASSFTTLWGVDRERNYEKLKNFEYKGWHKIKGVINSDSKYLKNLDNMIKNLSFYNMDKKAMEMAMENYPKDMKALVKGIHDSMYEEETTDRPFEKDTEHDVELLVNILRGRTGNIRTLKNMKRNIMNAISNKEKEARKMLKKFQQDAKKKVVGYRDLGGDEKVDTPNNTSSSSSSSSTSSSSTSNNNIKYITMKDSCLMEEDENIVDAGADKEDIDKAQTYLKLIVATKNILLTSLKCVLKENITMGEAVYKIIRTCNNYLATKYFMRDHYFYGTSKDREKDRKEEKRRDKEERKKKEKEKKDRRKRASKMESYMDVDYMIAEAEAEIYEMEL